MPDSSPPILKSTLIGGAVFGLLGAIPFVSALNCACCALIMGAGFLAAYLYSNDCKAAGVGFRPGAGAKLGFIAGIFYWLVNSIVQGLAKIVFRGPDMSEVADQVYDQMDASDAPPEAIEFVEGIFEVLTGPMGIPLLLVVSLVLALVFATIGGLIGGAVFKVEAPPAASGMGAPPPPPIEPGPGGN